MPPVKRFAAAGHINGGITGLLRAEALDDQSAENLRQVVRGFLALASSRDRTIRASPAWLRRCSCRASGKTVALSFAVPAEMLQLMTPKAPIGQ